MGQAIVTFTIMPKTPEIDRKKISTKAVDLIAKHSGEKKENIKISEEPVAFGLVAVKCAFVIDESKGIDELEKSLNKIQGVNSAEVSDMRRIIG